MREATWKICFLCGGVTENEAVILKPATQSEFGPSFISVYFYESNTGIVSKGPAGITRTKLPAAAHPASYLVTHPGPGRTDWPMLNSTILAST